MGLLRTLNRIRGGYPGGWRKYARGTQGNRTPEFVQPTDPDDRRSQIPALGLREYWYPALPAKDVRSKKPVGLRMLGTDLVFFRGDDGEVQALWDYCPHRGAYLSWGDCFWKGFVSCPYHGATFNGQGECVEFITEGPDSKMIGRLQARKYPTRTLKGLVFVWMGEGEPAPIEEDVPPEFFNAGSLVLSSFRYWNCNWMVALENAFDAHVGFYVHRNSVMWLQRRDGGPARTPMGARARVIDNKMVTPDRGTSGQHYAKDGRMPYQLYHPRVGGYWPLHRWRLLWTWFTEPLTKRPMKRPRFKTPPDWENGQRLPAIVRSHSFDHMFTRWVVPVEENFTRLIYFHSSQPANRWARLREIVGFRLYHNWLHNYNFSDQDYDAMRSVRYQFPEHLSSTDTCTAVFRRLAAEHARGVQGKTESPAVTTAERMIAQAEREMGLTPASELAGTD